MHERLGALLADEGDGTAYARLATDPGRVDLESLLAEIAKLEQLRALALPPDLLRGLHPDQAKRFRRRAAVESAWELRRHPERIRLPLLALWCAPREAEVVDGLVELLIQVTHRITVKAERRVVDELVEEAREVRGKAGILFRVVEAALHRLRQPVGIAIMERAAFADAFGVTSWIGNFAPRSAGHHEVAALVAIIKGQLWPASEAA